PALGRAIAASLVEMLEAEADRIEEVVTPGAAAAHEVLMLVALARGDHAGLRAAELRHVGRRIVLGLAEQALKDEEPALGRRRSVWLRVAREEGALSEEADALPLRTRDGRIIARGRRESIVLRE